MGSVNEVRFDKSGCSGLDSLFKFAVFGSIYC